ncbi:unnamed protein product [Rhizophagus irregularis]|nr:unnamed protein product [Rhizophagus irregularis]CAB5118177.1 unnamed protein product [Rhizophagus irregularis]
MVQNIMRSECIYIMSIKLSFQKSPNITQGFSYISKILINFIGIFPSDSNDELRTGQFVRPQWSFGTSSVTHMQDLNSLTWISNTMMC